MFEYEEVSFVYNVCSNIFLHHKAFERVRRLQQACAIILSSLNYFSEALLLKLSCGIFSSILLMAFTVSASRAATGRPLQQNR